MEVVPGVFSEVRVVKALQVVLVYRLKGSRAPITGGG